MTDPEARLGKGEPLVALDPTSRASASTRLSQSTSESMALAPGASVSGQTSASASAPGRSAPARTAASRGRRVGAKAGSGSVTAESLESIGIRS